MHYSIITLFCLLCNLCHAYTWQLGGDVTVQFQSTTHFECTENDIVQFSAHLPGFKEDDGTDRTPTLRIDHAYSESGEIRLTQQAGVIKIEAPWKDSFPPDFIHLLYGASRLEWLKQKIFPVHAACIGNDRDGYILLVGAPGSGKTSLTLNNAVKYGFQVFSGDKTLLRFGQDGSLEAIGGTHTITVRSEDCVRWGMVPKVRQVRSPDRLAFQLPPSYYTTAPSVKIKQIFMIDINDGAATHSELSTLSGLHTLYPFFLDKQREDTLIGGDQALLDGAIPLQIKRELQKKLHAALQTIPVYKVAASLAEMTSFIHSKFVGPQERRMSQKKILFGICGIGNGHSNREMTILRHLLECGHRIMVFTYGEGLSFFKEKFPTEPNLTVVPVANPYYVGSSRGLEFEKTALSEKNKVEFNTINSLAMHKAVQEFGRPDLVISDYEMVAAQYAYAKSAPLVTLDQQSKYLVGSFPELLHDTSSLDEVERLHLFFPKAAKRIAVSFFKVPQTHGSDVTILGPMIRPEIIAAYGTKPSINPSIVVYVTAQQLGDQPIDEWIDTIRSVLPNTFEAHFFLPKRVELPASDDRLYFYHHGAACFDSCLARAHGVVTTAGHTLLSEALYLEKPVLALPLPLYEQQLGAHIIDIGGFGISEQNLTAFGLSTFLSNLDLYSYNIRNDQKLLIKEPGNAHVIEILEELLEKPL